MAGPAQPPAPGRPCGVAAGPEPAARFRNKLLAEGIELSGYQGPGRDHPRKYVPGELRDAYSACAADLDYFTGERVYQAACKSLGVTPNSLVAARLVTPHGFPLDHHQLLGDAWISLHDTFVGERGFLALMPLMNLNTRWTSLDASNNGLRNEAVLHLVDMLLQPAHAAREIHLNLSRNPISDGGARALLELVTRHPRVETVDVRHTRIEKRLQALLRTTLDGRRAARRGRARLPQPEEDPVCGLLPEPSPTPAELEEPSLTLAELEAARHKARRNLLGGLPEASTQASTAAADEARQAEVAKKAEEVWSAAEKWATEEGGGGG